MEESEGRVIVGHVDKLGKFDFSLGDLKLTFTTRFSMIIVE